MIVLTRLALQSRTVTVLILILVLVGGIYAYRQLQQELFPGDQPADSQRLNFLSARHAVPGFAGGHQAHRGTDNRHGGTGGSDVDVTIQQLAGTSQF